MAEIYKKKKRTAYSFLYRDLVRLVFLLAGIVIVGIVIFVGLFIGYLPYSTENHIRQGIAAVQPVIREQCELNHYEANRVYWGGDPIPTYFHYLEEQNLQIECYSYDGQTWDCNCNRRE